MTWSISYSVKTAQGGETITMLSAVESTGILDFNAACLTSLRLDPSTSFMHIACFAFGLFALSFALHWIWWRVKLPRRQSAALLLLFTFVLAVGLAASQWWAPLADYGPRGFWACLQVAIFHIAMTFAYIIAYSALEERSPSMTLLVHVANARGGGRTRDELYAALSGVTPIESRLAAMTRDQMVVVDGRVYRITPKGRAWALTFGTWRRLIRLKKGG